MQPQTIQPLAALARCISLADGAGRPGRDDLAVDAYRELWALRRLLAAVRLTLSSAQWSGGTEHEAAVVLKHDLVLLEAAANAASGQHAATPDGFPHAGSRLNEAGLCDAGYCPCWDGRRPPQPRLLGRAA